MHERIGSGGMGEVYRAEQQPLGRPVALKLLKEEVAWDSETITRFHREAKAMSLLQSPCTVQVFDFGQTDAGLLFLAMELIDGETLTERVVRLGCLSPGEAIHVARQVLESLEEAHANSIIHRDLKPDNILLMSEDEKTYVKVLDFGIAKVFDGDNNFDSLETQAGTVFGTPRYMSPEQAQGKKLDARSDLYTVGVLLYYMLTGQAPFRDDDAVVVMAAHIREVPEEPIVANRDSPISRRLNRTVLRAMEKLPEKRFSSAADFSAELKRCADEIEAGGVGFSLADLGPRERPLLWVAAVIVLLSVVIAFVVIGAGSGSELQQPLPHDRQQAVPAEDVPEAPRPDPQPAESTTATSNSEQREGEETRIDSRPGGAMVWRGDERLGRVPLDLVVPETGLELELRRVGYLPRRVQLVDGEDQTVRLRRRGQNASSDDSPPAEEQRGISPAYERLE